MERRARQAGRFTSALLLVGEQERRVQRGDEEWDEADGGVDLLEGDAGD